MKCSSLVITTAIHSIPIETERSTSFVNVFWHWFGECIMNSNESESNKCKGACKRPHNLLRFQSERESHMLSTILQSPGSNIIAKTMFYAHRNTKHIKSIDLRVKKRKKSVWIDMHWTSSFIYHQQLYYYGARKGKSDESYLGRK